MIAEQTVQELQPLFERSKLTADQQRNVADALPRTLDEVDVARIVVGERFEPRPVFNNWKRVGPAAKDELDPAPYGLYRQALRGIGAAFCRVGSPRRASTSTLPRPRSSLDRLAGQIGEVLAGIGRTEEGIQRIEQHLGDEAREKSQIADENERIYREALNATSLRFGCSGSTSRRARRTSCRSRSPISHSSSRWVRSGRDKTASSPSSTPRYWTSCPSSGIGC